MGLNSICMLSEELCDQRKNTWFRNFEATSLAASFCPSA